MARVEIYVSLFFPFSLHNICILIYALMIYGADNFACIFAVPPNIEDALTSTDVVVREGVDVMLRCRASGSPEPSVKWKRDDNSKISINKNVSGKYKDDDEYVSL